MPYVLVVVRAFGPHQAGDTIADDAAIHAVLDGGHSDHVVRVARPVEPAQEG